MIIMTARVRSTLNLRREVTKEEWAAILSGCLSFEGLGRLDRQKVVMTRGHHAIGGYTYRFRASNLGFFQIHEYDPVRKNSRAYESTNNHMR